MSSSVNLQSGLRFLNIAFYKFLTLTDLLEHQRILKEICIGLELKGTILLSSEGINCTVAGEQVKVRTFQAYLNQNPTWMGLEYKESYSDFIPHQRMLVKLKKEIIPVGDESIKPAEFSAPRISAQELKTWLDENRDFELLDTRNEYEIKHGTFEKAFHLGTRHFRTLPEKMAALPEEMKTKPLVMFCTGGIRCEKAGVAALRSGFKEVYQLDGGILKYFEECGDSHYQGTCFVFDERLAVDSSLKAVAGGGEILAGTDQNA